MEVTAVEAVAEAPALPSAQKWQEQIRLSNREREKWETRNKKIIDRYRDTRSDHERSLKKFNILWSNIETLEPALYSATPVPVVVRRFRDTDPVGRAASEVLQRCLAYSIEEYDFDEVLRQNVLDYLLTGFGVAWVRYEPTFSQEPDPLTGIPVEKIAYEQALCDYVHWCDFACSQARVWEEVWWVGRRVYMTREEGVERFGDVFSRVPLDHSPYEDKSKSAGMPSTDKKATIWEIWDKKRRKVVWIHPDFPTVLDERDPPVDFRGFFPCPRPLYGTKANDNLVPVPDYAQYQDQALQLDKITARTSLLEDALRVAGVYDASAKDLSRLMNGDMRNILIPVANWAEFASKGGIQGSIQFVPLGEVAQALQHLYNAFELEKQKIYEITGISDIVRGASQASETATAQRIKAQWGSIRLRNKQREVQRYTRDLLRLKAEIIAELFQPETLLQMSGIQLPSQQEEMLKFQQAQQQHQMMAQQAQAQGQQPPPPPPEPQGPFMEDVVGLLRNDRLRTFRIDIETDSTIAPDEAQEKQDRAEFLQSFMTFLQGAAPLLPVAPELGPVFKDLMLFGIRAFRVGSGMEETIERSMDQLGQRLAQPPAPPPDPNQAKMAEIEANTGLKQQEMVSDFQLKREQMAGDMALEREKLIMREARNINPFMVG
jgi:hypothetical protein